MSNFIFNHDKKTLHESVGITEEEYLAVPEKLKKTAKEFLHKETSRRSRLVEEIINNYSYNEIVLIAATHIDYVITETEEKLREENPLMELFRRMGRKGD